ncbi:MAG: hypothetical protein M3Y57_19360 [Acidobacteriota bacterium]|nr:hypothetical protein [Acidobacteriota bacterium]
MKSYASRILLCSVLTCSLASLAAAQDRPGMRPVPPPQQVSTTVFGTIAQFNYDRNADVNGFLLGDSTLVNLPPRTLSRAETSLHKGDRVQIAGFTHTSPAKVQIIEAQTVQDRTSGKTLTMPQPLAMNAPGPRGGPAAPPPPPPPAPPKAGPAPAGRMAEPPPPPPPGR